MHVTSLIRFALILLCLFLCSPIVVAQSGEPAGEPAEATPSEENTTEDPSLAEERAARLATLNDMLESIAAIREDMGELEKERDAAATEEEKAALTEELESRSERIGNLEADFSMLATGIDQGSFFADSEEEFDWKQELEEVFAPVVVELKAATARSREMETLRGQIVLYDKRLPAIEDAMASLAELLEDAAEGEVNQQLTELSEFWGQQRDEIQSQRDATQQLLERLEQEDVGFGEAAGDILRLFFRERGINLLFAILAFGAIFLVLRALHRLIHRYIGPSTEGSPTRQLFFRLADVAYYLFTVVVAVGVLLVVLYLSADWVLLTLAVFVLIGLAWAARNAVPAFLEQGKLLLNVGAVREGERLEYNGIPWRVAVLSFFSDLENPSLRGGTIRLPLQDLIGMRSRPVVENEPWFPTELGHWVILEDGTYGEIVEQTPDVVICSTARGSYRSYPTVDFIAQHPKNLSSNFFSVNHVVGIDYKYRDIVITEVADKLKAALEEGFRKMFYGEHLLTVIVEFKEMSASSLDLITIAKFKGPAASEYTEIGWKLQQLALECCNENGWEIPFPQLTLHRAESST